jgi:hypothetical protein
MLELWCVASIHASLPNAIWSHTIPGYSWCSGTDCCFPVPSCINLTPCRWDRKYWATYKVLDILQKVFYRSNPAREAFVEMCEDSYVQKMTFDSYLYKTVVPGTLLGCCGGNEEKARRVLELCVVAKLGSRGTNVLTVGILVPLLGSCRMEDPVKCCGLAGYCGILAVVPRGPAVVGCACAD